MDQFVSNFQVWLLIFTRLAGLFVVAPFFSSFLIPFKYKMIMTIFITFIIFPILTGFDPQLPSHTINYGFMVVAQLLIGVIIGFIVTIIFTAFQLAAQFYHFQMGFGINQVFDPLSRIQVPILAQTQYLLTILVFLALNGHHMLINVLYDSFEIIPFLNFADPKSMQFFSLNISKIFSSMFVLALKIAFPLIGTMFMVSLTLGLLAKASPQMNILMVGFPIQIAIGLIAMIVVLPFFIQLVAHTVDNVPNEIIRFLHALQ